MKDIIRKSKTKSKDFPQKLTIKKSILIINTKQPMFPIISVQILARN